MFFRYLVHGQELSNVMCATSFKEGWMDQLRTCNMAAFMLCLKTQGYCIWKSKIVLSYRRSLCVLFMCMFAQSQKGRREDSAALTSNGPAWDSQRPAPSVWADPLQFLLQGGSTKLCITNFVLSWPYGFVPHSNYWPFNQFSQFSWKMSLLASGFECLISHHLPFSQSVFFRISRIHIIATWNHFPGVFALRRETSPWKTRILWGL